MPLPSAGSSCGWCGSPDRSIWESRIADGQSVAAVASETPFSVRAAYRHLKHAYDRPVAINPGVKTADYVARLVALADKAAEDGAAARAVGQRRTALEALRTEARILSLVLTRYGLDSDGALELMREGQLLATAVGQLIANGDIDVEVMGALSDELKRLGVEELAGAIDSMRSKRIAPGRVAMSVLRDDEAAQAALAGSKDSLGQLVNPPPVLQEVIN